MALSGHAVLRSLADLRQGLRRLCGTLPLRPGIAGLHLLQHPRGVADVAPAA